MLPNIEVDDIVTDPDFMQTFSVKRQMQVIGADGMAVDTVQVIPNLVGYIGSAAGTILNRRDWGEVLSDSITIVTTFKLIDGRTGEDADIITYNNNDYTVVLISDWSKYGKGFYEAVADMKPLVPQ